MAKKLSFSWIFARVQIPSAPPNFSRKLEGLFRLIAPRRGMEEQPAPIRGGQSRFSTAQCVRRICVDEPLVVPTKRRISDPRLLRKPR